MTISLQQHLALAEREQGLDSALARVLDTVASTCVRIASAVSKGALGGVLGSAGTGNVQGEEQKKLDIIANDLMLSGNGWNDAIAGMASEEMDHASETQFPNAPYLLLFDPLDGSSNIDVNVSIGTIFSVLPHKTGHAASADEAYLQPGTAQAAAGYCIYGPQTALVFTTGHGVVHFTLDRDAGAFIRSEGTMQIPFATKEFAINMSNKRHWEEPVRRYVTELLAGESGPRGKDFNMRWIASMVADVHRVLTRGGIFMYPFDARDPSKPGKLRLMYEANPMSFLVEQAGGAATNGSERILDIAPAKLHERVSVMLGSAEEVGLVTGMH